MGDGYSGFNEISIRLCKRIPQYGYFCVMSNDPLHGITLEKIVTELFEKFGWEELGYRIRIHCFTENPSVKSSLTFLRKTQWARDKVEQLYIREIIQRRK